MEIDGIHVPKLLERRQVVARTRARAFAHGIRDYTPAGESAGWYGDIEAAARRVITGTTHDYVKTGIDLQVVCFILYIVSVYFLQFFLTIVDSLSCVIILFPVPR